ncbi:MAG: hypothetical protein AAFR57_17605 [Pseudomonadota bacterium]
MADKVVDAASRQKSKDAEAPKPRPRFSLLRLLDFTMPDSPGHHLLRHPDAQTKARLLYEYCIASDRKVSETVHTLFIIAEHYAGNDPQDLESPEEINGIPRFFTTLTARERSAFCYNQVTETLSTEALPVTVNTLMATRRLDPNDPSSSVAGRFVQRVTRFVSLGLLLLLAFYLAVAGWQYFAETPGDEQQVNQTLEWASWIAFGCVGALIHLLNHALTTTRLQTFDVSEERKVWPRILLGGMFGFVVPWMLDAGNMLGQETAPAVGPLIAFFGGYSVRFSIGLLERLLAAVLPETRPNGSG